MSFWHNLSTNTRIALFSLLFSIIFSSIGFAIEYYTFVQPKIENLQVQLGNVELTANTINSNTSYNKRILFTNSSGSVVGCIVVEPQGGFHLYGTALIFDMRTIQPCQ